MSYEVSLETVHKKSDNPCHESFTVPYQSILILKISQLILQKYFFLKEISEGHL